MATNPVPVPTVRVRVLLGWMTKEEAVNLLTQEAVPPLGIAEAEALWIQYRDRVLTLPIDRAAPFTPLPMTAVESAHAATFTSFMAGLHAGTQAVKVDLRQLVAMQYYVLVDRSEDYAQTTATENEWLDRLMPTVMSPNPPVQVRFGLGPPHAPNPMSSLAIIDVPHGEFALLYNQGTGGLHANQFMRHATIVVMGQRAILKAGYHRTLARLRSVPTATVPTAVLAYELNVTIGAPNQPAAGAGVTVGTAALGPTGPRAALLCDFTTDNLFMEVSLRRKKYQLIVQSTWVQVDDI